MFRGIRFLVLLTGIFCLVKFSAAQVSQGGRPMQVSLLKSNGIPVVKMPAVNNTELQKKAVLQNSGPELKALKFAHRFDVDLSPENSGIWLPEVNGIRIWQVKISSQNAKSINLIFSSFNLPVGARLFVFSESENHYLGAFTSFNNKKSGKFAVSPVAGDEITVQYEVPEEQIHSGSFIITQVNHAFEDILKYNERRPLGKIAGSCNVDVNCDLGDQWQDVKDAVCRIIVNGVEVCSGTLLNNTQEDEKPYVISASHCYDRWEYAETSVYTFNYESPYCAPLDGDPSHSVSGAMMKAQFDSLDFALTELSLVPPPEYQPYFAGWDRESEIPASSTSIHHPQGDIKKITIDNDAPVFSSFNSDYIENAFLKINRWEQGVTEAGSSGGALFNTEKNLIGTLTGGAATCSNPVRDYFARFDMAWDYKADSTQQLKYWLDPNNTGLTSINGKRFYTEDNNCNSFTNLNDSDSHQNITFTNSGEFAGYWGGTNSAGIIEFVERFDPSDFEKIVAVSLGIGKLNVHPASQNSEIILKIYEGDEFPETLIHSEAVKVTELADDAMNRIELDRIVIPSSTFFVGFDISDVFSLDTVVVYQSLRAPEENNHFYFKQNGQWENFKDSNAEGYGIANVIELLACNITEAPIDTPLVDNPLEIMLYPNPTSSVFTMEAGKEIDLQNISIFNLSGQRIKASFSNLHGRKVEISLANVTPGIYVVRFDTGRKFVSKKISFVPR